VENILGITMVEVMEIRRCDKHFITYLSLTNKCPLKNKRKVGQSRKKRES
jgi:hypothetical protein